MSGNFIKLNRSMQEWGWYSDPITKAVFIELLFRARYHECEKGGVRLEIGDASFGRKELAKVLGITEQNVRTAIKRLTKTGEISTKKVTNRFTVVTITNWGKYQYGDDDDNQQTNHDLTNNQPTTNQQLTTNKERKKVIKKEGKNKESVREVITARWKAYPPEVQEALKEFKEFRIRMRKPLTDGSWKRNMDAINKWASINGEFDADLAVKIIHQSIDRGWAGLFEYKGGDDVRTDRYEKNYGGYDEDARRKFEREKHIFD